MRKITGDLYWHRGEFIWKFGNGWYMDHESCSGKTTMPVYKALKDVRNAIDKFLDGTNTEEPRVIATAHWSYENGWQI